MITIDNLSKHFKVYKRRLSMIKEAFGLARIGEDYDVVKSLQGINLHIPSGKVHGIIGMNGAGKSTLLKILTGVLEPSEGRFELKGRVAALLELGTGFHGELTGRENIFLNGTIMGMGHEEVQQKLEAIIAFSELGDFIDRPVKIYSSGMYVRLAFSFAVHVDPDVLIIDEALSVGDAYFQQKCLKKIQSFKDGGATILFVSHDLGAVRMLCEEVSLLHQGELVFNGSPLQALDLYNAILAEHKSRDLMSHRVHEAASINAGSSFESGNRRMAIEQVEVLNERGESALAVVSGQKIKIKIDAVVKWHEGIDTPTCGILLRDRLGYDVFGVNTYQFVKESKRLQMGDRVIFVFELGADLGAGEYTLTVALHADKTHVEENYHWIERAKILKVLPSNDYEFIGVARLQPVCHLEFPN